MAVAACLPQFNEGMIALQCLCEISAPPITDMIMSETVREQRENAVSLKIGISNIHKAILSVVDIEIFTA